MKKELLRLQNICLKSLSDRSVSHVSLHLLEGETIGFLGLANSGKDIVVDFLTGMLPYDSGRLSICGKKICDQKELKKVVYRMTDRNYLISDWTVSEYLGLVDNQSFFGIPNKRRLVKEAEALIKELDIAVDVKKSLKDITELEKRLVDIAKAYRKGAFVLLIEDEFEGLSKEELQHFKEELDRLIAGRMTAVISNHSDMVVNLLSDRFVVFKNGRITKKCKNQRMSGILHLEPYLLGESIRSKKQSLDNMDIEKQMQSKIVYEVKAAEVYGDKTYHFLFERGEVTTILALNRKEKEVIFQILSGHQNNGGVIRYLEQSECELEDIADFVRNKIVSVWQLGDIEELLPSMSAGENILIPSLNKLSPMEYTIAGRRIARMLEHGTYSCNSLNMQSVKELGMNERIALTLERWLVYHPKVLILFEPFAQCDTYGVSLVKSYIKKMAGSKTAVVVIKSREEYMEEISDRFIQI